ncbi:MAG: terminase family protein, partial [Candidatus Cloacimonetes bacterium]|nr:terminase family protein [Candidatus Cloacimonadota bacterium]
ETFLNHLFRKNKRGQSQGWILYPTYDLAEELFVEPFLALLARRRIRAIHRGHRITTRYGGIRVYQMMTPHRMVGSELTYVGFDEFDVAGWDQCDTAWKKALGRLRGCDDPRLYIVTTPEGFHYTHKLFVDEGEGKHLVRASATDNPHLPPSYLELLRAQYDDRLLAQYLDGEFVNLTGDAAYYAFDRQRHLIDDGQPPPAAELFCGMDFNVDPMVAIVGWRQDDRLIWCEEVWLRGGHTQRMCEALRERWGQRAITVCPDMTGVRRSTASAGLSDIAILKQHGFAILGSRNPLVRDRLNTVNHAFSNDKVRVMRRCVHLIRDLEQVTRDRRGELDKSHADLTHISDAMGYAICRLLPMTRTPRWRTSAAQKPRAHTSCVPGTKAHTSCVQVQNHAVCAPCGNTPR